ncbi:MAG: tetratricopeptide repeat protein [Okeania sp. SIO3B3]|nr:tetratricopeptide repeat protein [Okeania sp. SIO3B3]
MYSTLTPEMSAFSLNQEAESYLEAGKLDEAYLCCEKSLEILPVYPLTCKTLGNVLQAMGKLEEAISWYTKAIMQQPNWAEIYINIGSLYAKQNEWQPAIACYETAIELQPNLPGAYRNLSRVCQKLGNLSLAKKYWSQAHKIELEKTALEKVNHGDILLSEGKKEEAIIDYREAIELNPNLSEAYSKLGEVLVERGELDGAINCYQSLIELLPKNWVLFHKLGKLFQEKGKLNDAVEAFQKATELNPNFPWSRKHLADILYEQGKLNQALTFYERIIENHPNICDSYCKIGEIFIKQGKIDRAVLIYHQGIKLHPNLARFHYQLGEALSQQKKLQLAIQAYRRAVELRPDNYLFHEKLERSLKQTDMFKEKEEINFSQSSKTINFTIIPTRAGFTDQLLQFMMFYKLGMSLGYEYIHTDFNSNRSSQNVYDFLGFNRYWSVNTKDIDISNYSWIYLKFNDDNFADLKSMKSLDELQQYCQNLLDRRNFSNDTLVIFMLDKGTRARGEILSLINSEIHSYQDNLNFRKIYFENDRHQVKIQKNFDAQKIKLLVHIRAGDVAHIKTTWGSFIKSINSLRDEEKKSGKRLNDLNFFVDTVEALSVEDYYQFAKSLICYLGEENISTCIFSDGYKRSFDFIKRNIKKMKLTATEAQEIFKLSNSYESNQFSKFNSLENCACIIGENDEKLFNLIHSCMMADIFIIGSEQRMIPKILSNYSDLKRPPVIFILYKNRSLSSIMKTHFQDLLLDYRQVTLIPVNVYNYQINDLVSKVIDKINII